MMEYINEKCVNVRGVAIRHTTSGAGSPVLLIHGFGEFLEIWSSNVGPLSEHFSVYALDLPGHGLSQKPRIDYSLTFVTTFVADFMEAMGIERANLIGHSLGGLICLSTAINFPEKVDRLILVDSGGLSEEAPLLYRLCTIPVLGDIVMKPTIKAGLKMGIKKAFYDPGLITEEMIDKDYQYLKMPGAKETFLSVIRNNTSLNGPYPEVIMTDKLHLVRSPTLLIHGEQDRVIPVEHARNAHNLIPDAKLKILANCGHCPHIEKAHEFNESVVSFLASDMSLRWTCH